LGLIADPGRDGGGIGGGCHDFIIAQVHTTAATTSSSHVPQQSEELEFQANVILSMFVGKRLSRDGAGFNDAALFL